MSADFSRLKGVFPLVSMAFAEDGTVDYTSFERMVHFVCDCGADGVGLWGMMSEYYKLSDFERDRLAAIYFDTMRQHKAAKLVSVTDWSTEVAVKHAKEYQDKGADILMLLPPFYYQPTVEAVLHHIKEVAQAVTIPVLVQYAPQSTGMYIEKQVIADLAEQYPNIAFKIEHNPQLEFLKPFFQLKPDMKVMSGYAGLDMLDLLQAGVRGVMPGCSFTDLYVSIYRKYSSGDMEGAKDLYLQLQPFLEMWMTSVERLIALDKVILQRRGVIPSTYCRHPGYVLDQEDIRQVDAFMETFAQYLPSYQK